MKRRLPSAGCNDATTRIVDSKLSRLKVQRNKLAMTSFRKAQLTIQAEEP